MKITAKGFDKLRNDIANLTNRLRDLGPAYLRAGLVVLTAAQKRIRSKGDGNWPPEAQYMTQFSFRNSISGKRETASAPMANKKGSLLFRTGSLFRSLGVGGQGNLYEDLGNGIRVGTNLMTPDDRYSVGALMQYGTGPITPKNGRFLVFEVNGQKIFSKGTKGIPPRPFLFVNDDDAKRVRDVFASYVLKGKA